MDFLLEVASFGLKVFSIAVAVTIAISLIIAQLRRKHSTTTGSLHVLNLNNHYEGLKRSLMQTVLSKKAFKADLKQKKKQKDAPKDKRVYVLHFSGDIAASAVSDLREEVNGLVSMARKTDEVVVVLESPGGLVSQYGLAASQLVRLRNAGIPLTVCVDKVAASGGYLMAAVANKILAAPFAMLGSIGVLAMMPNFNRLLKRLDVDYLELTAGEYKTTLTPLGEVTEKGKTKFKQELEDVHDQFKTFISQYRPQLEVEAIATGEHWLGQQALELKLCDAVMTSDDYLLSQLEHADLYKLEYYAPKSVKEKMAGVFTQASDNLLTRWLGRLLFPRSAKL